MSAVSKVTQDNTWSLHGVGALSCLVDAYDADRVKGQLSIPVSTFMRCTGFWVVPREEFVQLLLEAAGLPSYADPQEAHAEIPVNWDYFDTLSYVDLNA